MTPHTPQTLETSVNTTEQIEAVKLKLRGYVDAELEKTDALLRPLLELRHQLFEVNQTEFSKDLSIADQSYEDPAYNVKFVSHDMGLRHGNATEYHQTSEKYDRDFSEENADRDLEYRQAILATAQELGFIAREPGVPTEEIDQLIGILDSDLEPIPEKVAAIIMDAGGGMTGIKRVRDAIRNIESGAVKTNRIIVASGSRPTKPEERGRVKPPFKGLDTEYDMTIYNLSVLLGTEFDETVHEYPVSYGKELTARMRETVVVVGDQEVKVQVIDAPFDPERTRDMPIPRTNTTEAYKSIIPLIEGVDGAIVSESHDTWIKWQHLMAQKVFGLELGRMVYPAGPYNAERVYWHEENGEKIMDILAPQDVIDEIIKTHEQLVRMKLQLQTA